MIQMANTGSLISLHSHDNMNLLNNLTEIDNVLYLYGERVCKDYDNNIIRVMVDDVWNAIEDLENTGGESDDTE